MIAPAARVAPPSPVASTPSPHVLVAGAASPDRFFVLLVLDLGAPTLLAVPGTTSSTPHRHPLEDDLAGPPRRPASSSPPACFLSVIVPVDHPDPRCPRPYESR